MGQSQPQSRINQIAPGFYNIRSSFKLKGIIDIGTHMSLISLPDDKFLVIDTVPLDDNLKAELDQLTDNGQKMAAVLATHPFHTLAFPAFYHAYPRPPYYGTPRHIRRLTDIPWAGDLHQDDTRAQWESQGVELRIPAGAEFVAPEPESYNHFNSVWVYSRNAGTVHVDDTVNYFDDPGVLMQIAGKRKGAMQFHDSIKGPGLYPTAEAPILFKDWVEAILRDWSFDNMCCAHIGNKIGGAHEALKNTLEEAIPMLERMAKANAQKEEALQEDAESKDCSKYNVEGNDCG